MERSLDLKELAARVRAQLRTRHAWTGVVDNLEHLLDAAPELTAWTHRLPDDPGIALCEGAAIVGDILAQYQHRYANEAYLRTKRDRMGHVMPDLAAIDEASRAEVHQ